MGGRRVRTGHGQEKDMDDRTVKDFKVGDVVRHIFHGRYATVVKVGRKYLTVRLNLGDQQYRWLPTSVQKVDV
jgi:hypothetical protein